jgi:hypothetical protein
MDVAVLQQARQRLCNSTEYGAVKEDAGLLYRAAMLGFWLAGGDWEIPGGVSV